MSMKYLIALLILTSACGKSPDALTVKTDAFSKDWNSTDPWWNVDLSGLDFTAASSTIFWTISYGQTCASKVVITGDKVSGTFVLSQTTQTSAPLISDDACSYYDGNWTYSYASSQLTMCQTAEPCVTFK